MTTPDPFASLPAADPAEVPVRRGFQRPVETVDLIGKVRPKRVDLNPMQRKWFTRHGWVFHRVEVANAYGRVMQDMWGCFDYVAVRADHPGTLYVQVTDKTNLAHRRRKILAAPVTPILLASGNRVQIHAWSQPGGPGSRWEVLIEEVTMDGGAR